MRPSAPILQSGGIPTNWLPTVSPTCSNRRCPHKWPSIPATFITTSSLWVCPHRVCECLLFPSPFDTTSLSSNLFFFFFRDIKKSCFWEEWLNLQPPKCLCVCSKSQEWFNVMKNNRCLICCSADVGCDAPCPVCQIQEEQEELLPREGTTVFLLFWSLGAGWEEPDAGVWMHFFRFLQL